MSPQPPVLRGRPRRPFAVCLALLCVFAATAVAGCEDASSTLRPSTSLLELEFTPQATIGSGFASPTTAPTAPGWPAGWDVAFCTAFSDITVAHELVIDIERALGDKARDDAAGLAAELGQTAPLASDELGRVREWEPATAVIADFEALITLYAQAADEYTSYFGSDGQKSSLRDARKSRRQVAKAVPGINDDLQQLAAMGVACPGTNLSLETF